jgi:hypothetical protein
MRGQNPPRGAAASRCCVNATANALKFPLAAAKRIRVSPRMAWRIHSYVVRGEIDNRTKGRVSGQLWLAGRTNPIALQLAGNCARDLAGRAFEFTNPTPQPGLADSFGELQEGVAGDITAARKVKVPEIPLAEVMRRCATRESWPWHWGDSLHLEWFSELNGRVVIEATDFDVRILEGQAWELSTEDENEQRNGSNTAMSEYMQKLVGAVEESLTPDDDRKEDGDDC